MHGPDGNENMTSARPVLEQFVGPSREPNMYSTTGHFNIWRGRHEPSAGRLRAILSHLWGHPAKCLGIFGVSLELFKAKRRFWMTVLRFKQFYGAISGSRGARTGQRKHGSKFVRFQNGSKYSFIPSSFDS